MVKTKHLNEKWIKASILGTIWAASEIVLGSFLHNLRVPFSGNILTAIGVVILIAASYKWKEKGIFWRAGVICALLKTMSPSAVIFGPFIAILSEAFLLEIATRIFGRTMLGFMLGSILAMSWNLFHKIFKMVVFYGNNIVDIYTNLMRYVEQQINIQFNAIWTPLLLLLAIQILFGTIAALTGIRTGLEAEQNPITVSFDSSERNKLFSKKVNNFPYSIGWMILNIVCTIAVLALIGRIHFGLWVVFVILIIASWAFRYKRALRQLVRPRLWIIFIVITMLTALVFTQLQSDTISLNRALLIGVEMNLRAIVLIMGFTVLGTELYNPLIRNWFAKSYFKQVPVAIQLSLESLPVMIANTPDLKTIIKNPTLFVHQIMAFADYRLNELSNRKNQQSKIFIVTGDIAAGKTSCIKNTIELLRQNSISASGILSPRLMEENQTIGYDIFDIANKTTTPFLRTKGDASQARIGKYFINPEGFNAGQEALHKQGADIIVIDEIGKLELTGEGWSNSLKEVLASGYKSILIAVRKEVLYEIIEVFNLAPVEILDLSEKPRNEFIEILSNLLPTKN